MQLDPRNCLVNFSIFHNMSFHICFYPFNLISLIPFFNLKVTNSPGIRNLPLSQGFPIDFPNNMGHCFFPWVLPVA